MNNWLLAYDTFDPAAERLREALCTLGNGYFAVRGAACETQADDIHYPGTYLAGGYNRLKTDISGHIVENEDLVNMPNGLLLKFKIEDGDWFKISETEILAYRQELDIRLGILTRSVRFRDKQKRETTFTCRRIVSMKEMHVAAQEIVIVPENCVQTYDMSIELAKEVGAFAHPGDLMHVFFLYHMALNGVEVIKAIE